MFERLTWVVFAIDYLVRLRLAPDRRYFVRHNVLDLAAVALPMFRAMRLLRLLSIATLMAKHSTRRGRARRTTMDVVGFAVLLVIVSSLAVLDAERRASEPSITTIWDSLWWSMTTMTTVGYGDVVPTTGMGRVVGVLVMLTGIAVLGVVTANVAAWFVSGSTESTESTESSESSTDSSVQALQERVDDLTRQLALARSEGAGSAGTEPPSPAVADSGG
jgi:voltage-gated potassium channel